MRWPSLEIWTHHFVQHCFVLHSTLWLNKCDAGSWVMSGAEKCNACSRGIFYSSPSNALWGSDHVCFICTLIDRDTTGAFHLPGFFFYFGKWCLKQVKIPIWKWMKGPFFTSIFSQLATDQSTFTLYMNKWSKQTIVECITKALSTFRKCIFSLIDYTYFAH